VRLSYESGRLCPLQTQDGKPLLELQFTNGGEALAPNEQMQARCRINELTSQHQKQRFLIEIIALGGAAAGAPPKGAVLFRSKPIDVRSRHKDVKGGKAKRDGEAAAIAAATFSRTTLIPAIKRARSLDIDMRSLPASRSPPSSSPTFGAPGGRSAFGGHRHGHHTRAFAPSPPNGNSASAEECEATSALLSFGTAPLDRPAASHGLLSAPASATPAAPPGLAPRALSSPPAPSGVESPLGTDADEVLQRLDRLEEHQQRLERKLDGMLEASAHIESKLDALLAHVGAPVGADAACAAPAPADACAAPASADAAAAGFPAASSTSDPLSDHAADSPVVTESVPPLSAADSALAQQSLPFTLSQFQQAEQPEQSEPPLASIPMTGCDGHDGDVDVTPAPEANRPTSPVPVRL
jgi:hypothetical protein